jgi:hypothetical protein
MSISLLQTVDIIEVMENFIESKRPPEELRDKVDLSFKIEGQSVIVYEIRALFPKPGAICRIKYCQSDLCKS